jgi:hypothetical protein
MALLVQTIPLVAQGACFALKGGTAINLVVRDRPCLSVDIGPDLHATDGLADGARDIDEGLIEKLLVHISGAKIKN